MDGQNYNNGQNNNVQNNGNQNNSASQSGYYQGYPANAYYMGTPQQQKEVKTNGIQIAGLLFGIISILTVCCYGAPGLIFGIVGLICSIVGNRRSKSGVGIAGLICSIMGLVFNVISTALFAIIVKAFIDIFRERPELLEDPEFLNDSEALMEMLREYFGR